METLKAISQLWPICLIVFLCIVVILFRKELKNLILRLSKIQFRKGETEVTIEQEVKTEIKEELSSGKVVLPEQSNELKVQEEGRVLGSEKPTTTEEWFVKMMAAFRERNLEDADEAFKNYQESEMDGIKKLERKALYLRLSYDIGNINALEELKNMSNREDINIDVRHTTKRYIGQCYVQASNFDMGLKVYEDAANISQTENQKATDIVEAAECIFKLNRKDEALQRIMDEIGKTQESEALSLLYKGLSRIYELAENYEFKALALDKVLEITPNDTSVRFSAGYSYGQGETKSLSFLHYKTLLEFEPEHKMALNNIGVECAALDMPLRAIQYYKKSAEKNETLAMANLANNYLNAGFKEEASETLDKAKKLENTHKNVGSALSAIATRVEKEKREEEKIIGEAREQQRFFLQFANAYFIKKTECPQFDGTWVTNDGIEMVISKKDKTIEAYWSSNDKKAKFNGEFSNRGAKITVNDYEKSTDGYAYITEDGLQLNIMKIRGNKHSMMNLVRK